MVSKEPTTGGHCYVMLNGLMHWKNSIGILTIEYGYLSFMFDLSTPGTEQMQRVCKMYMKECGGLRIE